MCPTRYDTGKPSHNRLDTVTADQCREIIREEIRAALADELSPFLGELVAAFLESSRVVATGEAKQRDSCADRG